MGEWRTESLVDCLAALIDYRGKSPPKSATGIPVLSAKVVKTTGLLRPIEQTIAPEHYSQWMTRGLPQPGDVVLTTEGPMGQVIQLDEESAQFALGQRIVCMRGRDQKLDNTYLRYLLTSPMQQETLMSYATGTTVLGISQKALRSMPISVPDFSEQKQIGQVLAALDDKIELNRRMNETLEAMARAIFKDWFVDFGPTRAKAEGRAPYLTPETWNLFPDVLDDEKPVGWHTYTLSDLVQHHRATVSPSAEPNCVFEHYSFPAYDAGTEPALNPGASIKSNKTAVPEGAVLLSKLNPETDRVWLPNQEREAPQVASTEFLAFTPVEPATRSILFCAFKSEGFRAKMVAMVTGTSKSHQRVSPRALLTREMLVAEPLLLGAFDQTVLPLIDRLLSNRREARTLAQTRDLLLPKLMSGELRPAEAEKGLEAVA